MADTNVDTSQYPKHTLWYRFFMAVPIRFVILPIAKWKLKIKTTRYKGPYRRPCILVYNHVSDYDFIGTVNGFIHYGRYMMSDELIRRGKLKYLIPLSTNGIFRKKGTSAASAIEGARETLRRGINVYIAAEGEESPNGVTAPIRPKTGQMIKDMNVDLITYKMEGGYLIGPKWARNSSKGPMFGHLVNIHPKEKLAEMTPEEINQLIADDLYFNHYDWIKEKRIPYDRECRAEWMEKVLHRCPRCEQECKLHSKGDVLACECGYKVEVDEYGLFVGDDLVFDNLYDWDMWQKERMRSLRPEWEAHPDDVITEDHDCQVGKDVGKEVEEIDSGVSLKITFNHLIIEGEKFKFKEPLNSLNIVSIRNGIGVFFNGTYYRVRVPYVVSMIRYRTIRRIIMNEKDI